MTASKIPDTIDQRNLLLGSVQMTQACTTSLAQACALKDETALEVNRVAHRSHYS